MALKTTIDKIIDTSIDTRIFPGAVVFVAQGDTILHHRAYGSTMYTDDGSVPVSLNTIYDIASLTKVFTATAVLRLVDARILDLDAPIQKYLKEVHTADITVKHLLTHTSGLEIRLSSLRELGREGLLQAVYQTEPRYPPDSVVAYTNVNSLLLGEIVEYLADMPLDQAIRQLVTTPLGLTTTCFCPSPALQSHIAPTEIDHDWRGRLVHGSVHDESTHALGGVAGHAGLFSTSTDLYHFCQVWLDDKQRNTSVNSIQWRDSSFLRPETQAFACMNHTPDLALSCGLGWMLDRPNFMGDAPQGSFGHTGFTGPAIIIIPCYSLIVVVLCNRVYPQRRTPDHHAVIASIVETAIENCKPSQ
ncbi:MAG: serine hydrolase domain-containing protein [Chloroflexota bacterium]